MNFYTSIQCCPMQSLKMKEGREGVREGRRGETLCELTGSDVQELLLWPYIKYLGGKWRGNKNTHTYTHLFGFTKRITKDKLENNINNKEKNRFLWVNLPMQFWLFNHENILQIQKIKLNPKEKRQTLKLNTKRKNEHTCISNW